jgi:hypothetical protein
MMIHHPHPLREILRARNAMNFIGDNPAVLVLPEKDGGYLNIPLEPVPVLPVPPGQGRATRDVCPQSPVPRLFFQLDNDR